MLPQNRKTKKLTQIILSLGIGLLLVFGGGYIKQIGLGSQPVLAQYLRPEFVAEQVYLRLSYLPKENQYVSQETGNPDRDNTLISRFIRYHQDIKKRPTRFRIDWQLSLADYLGANEEIREERYPGRSTLNTNPMEGDVKIISGLNRRQRKQLVDVLVSIYDIDLEQPSNSPNSPESPSTPTRPTPQTNPSPPTRPNKPPLSRPGDADLLSP
ncbi:hypothetical protein [Gloeothece citriformis]|nr:hypothetical protein [Gloeothece citriformis]